MDYCSHCLTPLETGMRFCPVCGQSVQYRCPEHHLQPGTVLNGRFLLGAALGEGGFGITYAARDLRLDTVVAIKEFYPKGFVNRNSTVKVTVNTGAGEKERSFFETGKSKFMNEAQILAKLAREPGIVQVRDFFESNNTAYIVMEYLRGQTLRDVLKQRTKLSWGETYNLMRPVMDALAKVHELGLIHRDVSPDNIMLTQNGVKLLDFGAARDVFAGDERSLTVMMKPGYTPEEQYSKRGHQGPWTDVYAVCATLYRCITGKTPLDVISRHTEALKPPSALGAVIDPAVENVLMKGMEILPDNRFASMGALVQAFEACRPVRPMPAPRPVPVPQPLKKDLPPEESPRMDEMIQADPTAATVGDPMLQQMWFENDETRATPAPEQPEPLPVQDDRTVREPAIRPVPIPVPRPYTNDDLHREAMRKKYFTRAVICFVFAVIALVGFAIYCVNAFSPTMPNAGLISGIDWVSVSVPFLL